MSLFPFEQIIIDAAAALEPEYEVFIKQLYQQDDESEVTNKQRDTHFKKISNRG